MSVSRACFRSALLAWVGLSAPSFGAGAEVATPAAQPADAQTVADRISKEVEQVRGLSFKRPVKVESQTTASFGVYVSHRIDEEIPRTVQQHYGSIVRALGLYRGPPIDFSSTMTAVMTSQVGAYYDPDKQSFFVLMNDMPELMQGVMYSHELYHAMQDQYFGLAPYVEKEAPGSPHRSADAYLARSAVVEGEATYVMSLWMIQKMTHAAPTRDIMTPVVAMQSNLGMDQLREMLKQPKVAALVGPDMQTAMAASNDIPGFIMDSMMGVYLKGLAFVFAVHEKGWAAVETLYADHPPESTEQVLHPEKWLAREKPLRFEWPDFAKLAALRDWQLLDDDTLGEFQWRSVFKEQGLAAEAEALAAGWGGDRYAVFKRKDSDATLLLLRSAWDSEAEAREFADGYRRALATKYAGAAVPTRVEQQGVDVYVVEGGDEQHIGALLKLVKRLKPV